SARIRSPTTSPLRASSPPAASRTSARSWTPRTAWFGAGNGPLDRTKKEGGTAWPRPRYCARPLRLSHRRLRGVRLRIGLVVGFPQNLVEHRLRVGLLV